MDKSRLFPRVEYVDTSLARVTTEGEYSITKPRDAYQIVKLMQKKIDEDVKNCTIIDATACIGGDTINFALNFKKVRSFEIDEMNFDALKHNVQLYDLDNVELVKGDCTQLNLGDADVLYMDPPWGGPEYRFHETLDLKLSNISIDTWVANVMKQNHSPEHIFIKLPFNYDFNKLKNIPSRNFEVTRIRNFYIAYIQNGFYQDV